MYMKAIQNFLYSQGTAEYSDNGTICQVSAGDVTICPPGQGHSITNKTEEVVEVIALVVYE